MSVTLSIADRPVSGLSDSELLSHLDDITTAERALAAARLTTVAELCVRGIPAARGYARPIAFLREHLKCHQGAAGQMHRLATACLTRPEIADALAKGTISEAQAAVIASSVEAIAAEATQAEQTAAAAILLSQAAVLAPHELAICGNRILHHVAPDTAEQRDQAQLRAAERAAWQARAFTIRPDGHGRYRLRGSTTAEGAAMLHAILDPLTHPRRNHGSADSASAVAEASASADSASVVAEASASADSASAVAEASASADSASVVAEASASADSASADSASADSASADSAAVAHNAFRDRRGAAQRRHDALLDACRLLLAARTLPDQGGGKPQIAVMVGFDPLRQQLGGGVLDTGAVLSAGEARKMACDAGILPTILDGHGVPLDLGRERRLISGALRKALIVRDRGCAWPGCDRPPRWCQAHHQTHWSVGGKTCLSNSVLMCGFHHALLHHDDGWTVHIGADGHPWFTPPAHLDPQQTPRRNLFHHRN